MLNRMLEQSKMEAEEFALELWPQPGALRGLWLPVLTFGWMRVAFVNIKSNLTL